jgi:hypothetical protein
MNVPSRRLVAALIFAVLSGSGADAAAQGTLAEVRALYAAAAYEDALSALAKVDLAAGTRGEAEQFRAFCLIALGRTADAERAIEAVVSADPLFVPQSSDISPRILAMFNDVRRRLLPEIARHAYLDARSAFQSKDFSGAARQFEQVMRLIDQAGAENAAAMDDLRLLVSGFVDLTRAATETSSPRVTDGDPGVRSEDPRAPAGRGADDYTAPVVVQQELPRWNPPTAAMSGRAFAGAVRVVIGPDGRVHEATVMKPVHPLYDPLVLQAARRWVYRPATRLGEPTVAEKVVEIRLAPR